MSVLHLSLPSQISILQQKKHKNSSEPPTLGTNLPVMTGGALGALDHQVSPISFFSDTEGFLVSSFHGEFCRLAGWGMWSSLIDTRWLMSYRFGNAAP